MIAIALSLLLRASAGAAVSGWDCRRTAATVVSDDEARAAIADAGVILTRHETDPGLLLPLGGRRIGVAMYYTSECLWFLTISGTGGTSAFSYERLEDRSLAFLSRSVTGSRERGAVADTLTFAADGEAGSVTTAQLMAAAEQAAVPVTLGGRQVPVSFGIGTLTLWLPGRVVVPLPTAMTVYRTGPRWLAYDLSPYGLPPIAVRYTHEPEGDRFFAEIRELVR